MPYDNENNEETTEMMNVFIPIQKVNMERREVWGWGAIEEPDNSDEILDYASSKPNFVDWSQKAQKRSGGKSLGNVRAMHQNIAAGKLIELKADDVHKGFYVGAKIVDDNEWKKVVSGVYTGFSVGGAYEKRWSDFQNPGKIRYTARPTELSIVDSPCIPSATFDMVKTDGTLVKRKFKPGEGKNMIAVVTEPRMIKVASSSRLIKVEWDDETPAEFKARHAEKVTKGDGMPEEFVDDEEFAEDEIPEEELEKEEVEEEFDEEEFDKADDEELPEDDLDEEFEDLGETAPEASTEEVMKIVQSALVDVGELLMAAEKVLAKKNGKIPESPEPIADIPLPGKLQGGSFTTEQMPAPSVLLEINPNSVPAQQVLAEHAVMSKDLTDAFNAWMPQVGAMVKTAVAEEVKKAVAGLLKNTNSAPVQIKEVSPRIIKVRKENTQ